MDGQKPESLPSDPLLLACWRGSDPDFGSSIPSNPGQRQPVGQEEPVDVDDEQDARGRNSNHLNKPVRPPMKHQYAPEERGYVTFSGDMSFIYPVDVFVFQDSDTPYVPSGYGFLEETPQFVTKPLPHGYAEPLLPPCEHLGREEIPESRFQDMLSFRSL